MSIPLGAPDLRFAPRPVALSIPQVKCFMFSECQKNTYDSLAIDNAIKAANDFAREQAHQTGVTPILKSQENHIAVIYFVKENRKVKL